MPSANWKNLPRDLLDLILEELVHRSPLGFVRYMAVCRSWHSVAIDHKSRIEARRHIRLPPMLLITQEKYDRNERQQLLKRQRQYFEPHLPKLYSISEGRVYNLEIKVPLGISCVAASYSWLAIQNESQLITLLNPFTQKSIPMSRLDRHFRLIKKAILSGDPSTCDDFVLAAIFEQYFYPYSVVAFIRAGTGSWTFLDLHHDKIWDIIFHQGLLYVMAKIGLLAKDCRYVDSAKVVTARTFSHAHENFYLAKSPTGDLLLVHITHPGILSTANIVYKLETIKIETPSPDMPVMDRRDWVEIGALGNNDDMFLLKVIPCAT